MGEATLKKYLNKAGKDSRSINLPYSNRIPTYQNTSVYMKAFVSVLMYATNRPLGRRSSHAQKFTFITSSKIFPTSEEADIFHECAPTGGK